MKKLLIFDAYGTLLSTGHGSVSACEQILALQDKPIDPVAFYADWKKLHRAHIDRKGKYAGISLPESQRPDHILSDLTPLLNVYPQL